MKPTLRNSVKEVYKKSNKNNNNYGFNSKLLNNNNNTSNNISVNNNRENNKANVINNKTEPVSQLQSPIFNINTILIIVFFLIIAGIIGAVIYFKDTVLDFIKNTFFKEETERTEQEINDLKNELEENQKNKLLIEQELEELRKQKLETESEKNKVLEEEKPKEQPKNTKKSKKSNEELRKLYSDNQFVKDDGFCYIGTDNNMRQCVEVYKGDICESGDVYKRIDECLMPSHFKN